VGFFVIGVVGFFVIGVVGFFVIGVVGFLAVGVLVGSGVGCTGSFTFSTSENLAGITSLDWPGYCQAMAKLSPTPPSFIRAYSGMTDVRKQQTIALETWSK
jgi:hypothetical protein